MTRKNKRLIAIVLTATLILFIPLIAMQFTYEVNWEIYDFFVAGALLFGAGLGIEVVIRSVKNTKYKFLIALAILALLFLIWVELAVGIFGTPFCGS
jgi:hypothetical protein